MAESLQNAVLAPAKKKLKNRLVKTELATLKNRPKPMEDYRETPIVEGKITVENKVETIREENTIEWVLSSNPSATPAASGGYLARPSNIYAEAMNKGTSSPEPVKEPVLTTKTEPSWKKNLPRQCN